jgi:hypothetical protein
MKGPGHLETVVHGMLIVKWYNRKWFWEIGNGLSDIWLGPSVDFCEHGAKALGFIKGAEWVSDLGSEEGFFLFGARCVSSFSVMWGCLGVDLYANV